MTTERAHLKIGAQYTYRERGAGPAVQCQLIAFHPDDGAYLIMEEVDREDGEICHFFGGVREELGPPEPPRHP